MIIIIIIKLYMNMNRVCNHLINNLHLTKRGWSNYRIMQICLIIRVFKSSVIVWMRVQTCNLQTSLILLSKILIISNKTFLIKIRIRIQFQMMPSLLKWMRTLIIMLASYLAIINEYKMLMFIILWNVIFKYQCFLHK